MLKTIKIFFFFFTFLYIAPSFAKTEGGCIKLIYRESLKMAKKEPWLLMTYTSLIGTISFLGLVAQKRYDEGKPVTTARETLTAIGMVLSTHTFLHDFIKNFYDKSSSYSYSYYPLHKKIYECCAGAYEASCGEYPSSSSLLK